MKNKINFTSKTAMVVTIVGIGAWALITLIMCARVDASIRRAFRSVFSADVSYSNVEYDNVFEWQTMPNENPDLLTPIDRNADKMYFDDDNYIDPVTYMRNYGELSTQYVLFRGRMDVEYTGITIPGANVGEFAKCAIRFPDGRYVYALVNYGNMSLQYQDVIDVYGCYLSVVNERDAGLTGSEDIIVIMPDFIYYAN